MSDKAHRWSGWPGAFCLDCGAEHAMEIAVAENWMLDIDPEAPEHEPTKWKSDTHKDFVNLFNANCPAKMTKEEFEPISARLKELAAIINAT